MQRRRFPFQINALTLPFQKNFFILFRQGNDLNVQPQTADHMQCRIQLSLSTVNDDQVRQVFIILIPAVHRFLHGLEIVRLAFRGLQFKTAIVLFAGGAVTKHHHGGYRFASLVVGNIKTVHAGQRSVAAHDMLQFFRRFLVGQLLHLTLAFFFLYQFFRIVTGQLHQFGLVAAPGR